MITRDRIRLAVSLRFSWRNIAYSTGCACVAFGLSLWNEAWLIQLPITVVAILGTALAIILGFKTSSAYDRWWEARKIWGGVVNESRTLTRQVLTMAGSMSDPQSVIRARNMVRVQLAWVNALRLQLRRINDPEAWARGVHAHLAPQGHDVMHTFVNKVTHLGMQQGVAIRELQTSGAIDGFQYMQLDGTLSRLTDLQGMAERIRATPLPRPYDYYTRAFLNVFILFFPFGVLHPMATTEHAWAVIPVTAVVAWIFHQLYVFGKVMSNPFENWATDVPLDAICTTIEIDLRQALGDSQVPAPAQPVDGVLM